MKNIIHQDQRLVMLRSLIECDYDANESILKDCLAVYGHRISRDLVRTHLLFLEEQDLVKINRIQTGAGTDFFVASITTRGVDVAEGHSVVAGVKKPSPRY